MIKANKCLFVLRSLRKEGFSQGEVDHLFSALVLPNFTYGLPVYGAVDSDLTVIQNFLDRCFKRKYTSKRMDIRELLEKADKKLLRTAVYENCSTLDSHTITVISHTFAYSKTVTRSIMGFVRIF